MNPKALIAEFIGTFTLIFIGAGSIAANAMSGGQSGLVGIALAHGLAIAVMVSATAAISGGHLNPAVTLGVLAIKRIELSNAMAYIIAQSFGAIFAAFAIKMIFPSAIIQSVNLGTPSLGPEITIPQAFLTELILTFFLMFVVYGTAVHHTAPKMGGLFIGLTICMDVLVGGPMTGAAMNPARHLGPALLGGDLQNIGLYWLGPIAGAILAAKICKNILE